MWAFLQWNNGKSGQKGKTKQSFSFFAFFKAELPDISEQYLFLCFMGLQNNIFKNGINLLDAAFCSGFEAKIEFTGKK